MRFKVTIEPQEGLTSKLNKLLMLGKEQGLPRSFKCKERWRGNMRYQVILEFDEDWTIGEIKRMLHEVSLDSFCYVIDVKDMESVNDMEEGKHEFQNKSV